VNLNHIFLFLAVISPLLVLARAWRPGSFYRGWRIAAFVVLVISGVAWIFFRSAAGYIAGGAWFAFLFLPAIGLRKVTELAASQHYRSARKLAAVLQILHPSAELREQVQLFHHLESHQNDPAGVASFPIQREIAEKDRHRHFRNAPAVFIFILLNAAAFTFEISFGNWTDPEVLHQLGALEPYAVVMQGQYWRLFTALFLHAGFLHLLFNLFALYVLGPPLERSIGALRFAICYLISGLVSSAGVVLLTVIGIVQVAQLVGASGCIMGIVGAWAGFLLRHRHAPHAKQRLGNVLMIVAIQIAFDLSTPQVSMAAHLCGLFSGAVLGFVLTPRPSNKND
jgi:membrane associated rhomboid family serine protease